MAHIVYSTSVLGNAYGPPEHNARVIAKPQYMSATEGSVVRVDVLVPGKTDSGNRARGMHTAYWLEISEAVALAEALKAAATLAAQHDTVAEDLFNQLPLRGGR